MIKAATFSPVEVGTAFAFGIFVEVAMFVLFALAQNTAAIHALEEEAPEETPIEVKPVLDELPLLKLGSKKVKAKLPDMWVKKPPIKRYKATSAPTPKAEKTVEKIPETPVATGSTTPPPPDAQVAKEVDEDIPDTDAAPKKQNLPEEGAEDGVKEGTETDPLKAFAVSQYRMKIAAWFNSRFKPPTDEIPCEELKKLRASVVATIGSDRSVQGYSLTSPSGNSIFDSRVKSTMDGIVSSGAELPPPPPNYPDVLGTSISAAFFRTSCN